MVGEKKRTSFKSENFTFSLWAVSKSTEVKKKEELIYPLSSLVAEFGGTLGLFLEFSFMTLWDKIHLPWHKGFRDVQSHLFWNNKLNNIFVKSFNWNASNCTGLYQTNAFQKPSYIYMRLLCPMYYKLFNWSCCYIKEFYFNEKQFDWYKILEKERMQENILKLLVYFVKLKKTFKSKQLV